MNHKEDAEWRKKYKAHISSSMWRGIRMVIIKMRGNKCEHCNFPSISLELHHKTYERLGNELASDLELLCKKCHEKADQKRVIHNEIKKERRRVNNAFATWFYKKTGSDPCQAIDSDYDDFYRWLERKQDCYQDQQYRDNYNH